MSEPSFDCYLCGTANPASADYCEKCSGQLLKLPDAPADTAPAAPAAPATQPDSPVAGAPSEPPAPESAPQPPARKIHASVEDQRLSDALGLTEPANTTEHAPVAAMQSAEPEQAGDELANPLDAAASAAGQDDFNTVPVLNIANVNENPRGKLFTSRGDEEVGPIAWVIVAMLFAAVGWFGYSTLSKAPDHPTPESIGFVAETTTAPPTTTTVPEVEPTTARDVDLAYSSSLVRIVPFQCAAGEGDQNGDPLVGVAIDEQNVLVGTNLPAGTNTVRIISRTGATRIAILRQQDGVTIATSPSQTSRNLEIESFGSDTAFYIHYDLEDSDSLVTETSQNTDVEIEVSEMNEIHRVRVGTRSISAEELAAIDFEVEIDETRLENGTSTCRQVTGLVFTDAAAEELANATEDSATEDGATETE